MYFSRQNLAVIMYGEELKALRRKWKTSYAKMAKKLDISEELYRKIESGKGIALPLNVAERIRKLLGITTPLKRDELPLASKLNSAIVFGGAFDKISGLNKQFETINKMASSPVAGSLASGMLGISQAMARQNNIYDSILSKPAISVIAESISRQNAATKMFTPVAGSMASPAWQAMLNNDLKKATSINDFSTTASFQKMASAVNANQKAYKSFLDVSAAIAGSFSHVMPSNALRSINASLIDSFKQPATPTVAGILSGSAFYNLTHEFDYSDDFQETKEAIEVITQNDDYLEEAEEKLNEIKELLNVEAKEGEEELVEAKQQESIRGFVEWLAKTLGVAYNIALKHAAVIIYLLTLVFPSDQAEEIQGLKDDIARVEAKIDLSTNSSSDTTTPFTYICTADEVNLRKSPDLGSEIKGSVNKGYRVMVIEREGGWIKVQFDHPETKEPIAGWVAAVYFESSNE